RQYRIRNWSALGVPSSGALWVSDRDRRAKAQAGPVSLSSVWRHNRFLWSICRSLAHVCGSTRRCQPHALAALLVLQCRWRGHLGISFWHGGLRAESVDTSNLRTARHRIVDFGPGCWLDRRLISPAS